MSCSLRAGAALAPCLALTLFASRALAFCRTNSCDAARGDVCTVDENGCRVGGKLLFWQGQGVGFSVQADGSPKNQISAASFESVIATAFDSWTHADCGSGYRPSLGAMSLGEVTSSVVEFTQGEVSANVFLFRDDMWLGTAGGDALALTTVWYDWHTGRIYGADVEINGTEGNITNTAPTDGADLPSIVAHETGHFLGLDHSSTPSATMYAFYEPGQGDLRVLDADDVAGICAIYPPVQVAPSSACNGEKPSPSESGSASAGESASAACTEPASAGCSFSPGRADVRSGLLCALVALVSLLRLWRPGRRSLAPCRDSSAARAIDLANHGPFAGRQAAHRRRRL